MKSLIFVALFSLPCFAFGQAALEMGSQAQLAASAAFHPSQVGYCQPRDAYTRETLDEYFEHLAAKKLPPSMPGLLLRAQTRVGEIGVICERGFGDFAAYRVLQQVEGEGALVNVIYVNGGNRLTIGPFLFTGAAEISQVPDEGVFTPRGIWEITGTFKYESLAGEKTVLVVERAFMDTINMPERLPHIFLYQEESREWTHEPTKETVKGIYLGYRAPTLWLMDMGGRVTKHSLFEYSRKDQDFVRASIKAGKSEHLIKAYEQDEAPNDKEPREAAKNNTISRKKPRNQD